jgi:hypothetical protein
VNKSLDGHALLTSLEREHLLEWQQGWRGRRDRLAEQEMPMNKRSLDDIVVEVFTFIVCAAPIAMLLLVLIGAF